MQKKELIYEGKGKKMFATDDADLLIAEFKDDLTAFDAQKRGNEAGKGALNNKISTQLFHLLKEKGIPTHLVETLSDTEQLVKKCEIIPLEVVVRNIATGSLTKRLAIKEGTVLPFTLVEFYYKNDDLDDPFINDEHVKFLKIANDEEIAFLKEETRRINKLLSDWFHQIGLKLIDFKLEFGFDKEGKIILADEFSPDNCRLWDAEGHHMDKDVFRRGLGELTDVYQVVWEKLQAIK